MRNRIYYLFMIIALALNVNAQEQYVVTTVAESDYQWTGIALSQDKRMFVNFPTWDVPSPYKVAEMKGGKACAYPSEADNNMFVNIQSVVIDDLDRLWILDTGNPQFKGVVASGARLFRVNLKNNKIDKTYSFPESVAPQFSYLNDLRVDTRLGYAYLTDSELGGIIVLNLVTGKSWRALDSTIKQVKANRQSLYFQSTGEWNNSVHSDGLELSADGATLYFTALTGDILYAVPTKILRDRSFSVTERASFIKVENSMNIPTDGMILSDNKLYMGDLLKESVWVYDLKTGRGENIYPGFSVRWADSFAKDNEGGIYFTTSQINYPIEKRNKYKIIKMEKKELVYPKSFSHIGITVPDLDAAVRFYQEVMGWYVIMKPTRIIEEKETAIGQMCIDVFGEGWGDFRIAHLATSDKIGVELFEFKQSAEKRPDFNPFQSGLFHYSVQDPDIEGLVKKIVAAGGKQRMPIRSYYPGEKPFKMCYVEDPFGVVFEIYTHSYEMTYSQGAY